MSDTEADLAGLRAVAERATPGPWGWRHFGDDPESTCRVVHYPPQSSEPWKVVADDLWPATDAEHIATFDPPTVLALLDRVEAAEAKVARVEALFAGGPDTSCRTTWRPGFGESVFAEAECVEVPLRDLIAALADPGDERGQR